MALSREEARHEPDGGVGGRLSQHLGEGAFRFTPPAAPWLVLEISEHIDEARSSLEIQSEAEVRTLLDRLGDPADIATEAHERFGTTPKGTEEAYGFRRRIVYFFVAVPAVFGVLWLVLSAARAVAG